MALLDDLGIDQSKYDEASGSTVTEAFEVLPSGAYDGSIKEMILYKNAFDGTDLRITVTVKADDKERDVSFQKDVGKTLKSGEVNEGFINRLKSVCTAVNVDINSLSTGEAVEVNSFGKKCAGQYLVGANGKAVRVAVKMARDTNKAEGEAYRDQNFLEAILVPGTEDEAKFTEKVEKLADGIFQYKGYVKNGGGNSTGGATSEASAEDKAKLDDLDF